jgi:hypothetical protein
MYEQREQITNARNNLLQSEGYVDTSIKTLRGMARRHEQFPPSPAPCVDSAAAALSCALAGPYRKAAAVFVRGAHPAAHRCTGRRRVLDGHPRGT